MTKDAETVLNKLRKKFKGEIITSQDSGYESFRSTEFFKGTPAVIFRPTNPGDIALAIKYSRAQKLNLSVRSGGHSGAGFGTNVGGAVIDTSQMNKVKVLNKAKGLVRIESGAVWGSVARTLNEQGLAISSGDTLTVGVGGLTLGGGIGWMVRKFGLAIDSLVASEAVMADGKLVRASDKENPELFWAIRGGGGNFGVVTAFEFTARPVGKVFFGNIVYGLDNLPKLMIGWRDAMRKAPEELTTMLVTLPSFMGAPPSAIVMCCFAGDNKAVAGKALAPFRKLGKVLSDDIALKDYFEILQEAHPPAGFYAIVKNGFVQDFDEKLIKIIASQYKGETGPIYQIRSVGGAMNRVATDATAFAHRDSEVLIISPMFVAPDSTDEVKTEAQKTWRNVAPFTSGGYVNFFSEHDEEMENIYPKQTLERLRKVKKDFDPHNVFNQNYNIKI